MSAASETSFLFQFMFLYGRVFLLEIKSTTLECFAAFSWENICIEDGVIAATWPNYFLTFMKEIRQRDPSLFLSYLWFVFNAPHRFQCPGRLKVSGDWCWKSFNKKVTFFQKLNCNLYFKDQPHVTNEIIGGKLDFNCVLRCTNICLKCTAVPWKKPVWCYRKPHQRSLSRKRKLRKICHALSVIQNRNMSFARSVHISSI